MIYTLRNFEKRDRNRIYNYLQMNIAKDKYVNSISKYFDEDNELEPLKLYRNENDAIKDSNPIGTVLSYDGVNGVLEVESDNDLNEYMLMTLGIAFTMYYDKSIPAELIVMAEPELDIHGFFPIDNYKETLNEYKVSKIIK